jgi:hypothetical protein
LSCPFSRPTITRRPTNIYNYEAFEAAETLQRPKYNKYNNYERYDPFSFQNVPKKQNRPKPKPSKQNIR